MNESRLSDYLEHIRQAATKLLQNHGDFLAGHPDVPWASMKGMRNRLAHGYFDINLDVVWDTVSTALPSLLERLPVVLKAAREIPGDSH